METVKKKYDKYFYANENNCGMYDDTIKDVVPLYKEMHRTMINILKFYFKYFKNISIENIKGAFLDIGSGTGEESIGILKNFPNLTAFAVDFSEPMLQKYVNNAEDNNIQRERYKLFNYDVLDPHFVENMKKENNNSKFDIIISAFTIHHYEISVKRTIYNNIFNLLKEDGIFINGDLFNYNSTIFSNLADIYDQQFIIESFKEDAEKANGNKRQKLMQLSTAWVKHYQEDNILDSVEDQILILRELGFSNVVNPFRFWQVGIITGTK